jgi:transposase
LDEAGIDDNETYPYGWGPKGERVQGMKPSKRDKRTSIISALNQGVLEAPFVFEGYCSHAVFEAYVEKVLLPVLIPGQTVIMDNASFHKSKRIQHLIESKGCRLLYLPAYSPDLNPIEHYWHMIKSKMRAYLKNDKNLYRAAQLAFQIR